MMAWPQENQPDKYAKLRSELLAAFEAGGKEGVRDFIKGRMESIDTQFIVDFAEDGMKKMEEDWLKVSMILAETKEDQKTIADVLYHMGQYSRLASSSTAAIDYFDKAFNLYIKINDLAGQGNVFRGKGDIYFIKGNNQEALKMYDKALPLFEETGDLMGLGNVYKGKGQIYFYTGQFDMANKMYDKALSFFIEADNPQGQGIMYLLKGLFFYYAGDLKNASEAYEKALPLFEKTGDPAGLGNVYRGEGDIYLREGKTSLALERYEKAMSSFEQAKNLLGQANVYRLMGNIHFYNGEHDRALEIYEKALGLYKKVEEILGQGNIFLKKGQIYLNRGNNSMAMEMFDNALVLFEQGKDPMGRGNIYYFKGDIYFFAGVNSKAIEMYDKAMSFFKKIDEPLGQGNVLHRKGDIYFYTGNNSKALEMYGLAVPFFKRAGDQLGQGNILEGTGDIYFRIGDHDKALELYDKALNLFEKANAPSSQAEIYHRKGFVFHYKGDDTRAFKMLDKALAILEKEKGIGSQGDVHRTKGNIYLRTGKYSDALKMYNIAFTFFEKENYLVGMGDLYRKKGETYFYMGDYSRALEMYEKGETLLAKAGDIESVAYASHGKASVLEKLGKTDEALRLYKDSILELEKVRSRTATPEMKQTFMESIYDQYEKTVVFMLTNQYYDMGFNYLERMKARVFLDRLAEGLVPLEKGISPELRQKSDDMVSELSRLSKQIDEATTQNDLDKLKELEKKRLSLQTDFDQLQAKIRSENKLYASVRYPEPVTTRELQENVLKEDEIMLRYFITPNNSYVFIISKTAFKVIPLTVNEGYIRGTVKKYLDSVGIKNTVDIKKYARNLYTKIFKPTETMIKPGSAVLIVPDGELAKIPFESFVVNSSGKPEYLLERYRLKYIQSATVLAFIREYYKREGTTNHFFGFGDPVYDYENFIKGKPERGTRDRSAQKKDEVSEVNRTRYAKAGGMWGRIKASGEEVKTIAELFKRHSQQAVFCERKEANEENAKLPDLKKFGYIHFSCHGVLGKGFQCLVLSQLPKPLSKEDGYLTLNEIMNCEFNAKLVVLSACQTGEGKMEKGEGVTGMMRAVMYAGTPAVVASLWAVDDIATKELMIRFYRYMIEEKLSKEEALKRAKLDLMKSKEYSSPFFWSAFVMYGE